MNDAELLREALNYDLTTGVFLWAKPRSNRCPVGSVAGSLGPRGYRLIHVLGKRHYAHRLAWLWVNSEWPPVDIDHRDGNPSNNAFANLRLATDGQNFANGRMSKRNKSGFKGVHWSAQRGMWRARLMIHGKFHDLGHFDTAEEAGAHAQRLAATAWGPFHRPK